MEKINKTLSEYLYTFLHNVSVEIEKKNIDRTFTSFAFQLEVECCSLRLIDRQSKCSKVFYFAGSGKSESFIAFNSVFSISEKGEARFSTTEERVDSVFDRLIDNHACFPGVSIPLFLGAAQFEYDGNNLLWNDYSDSEWFIPKYLIIKKGDENFIIINSIFAKGDSVSDSVNREMEELKRNVFDEDGLIFPESNTARILDIKIAADKDEEIALEKREWLLNTEKAIELIKEGRISKVVLSRKKILNLNSEVGLKTVFEKLYNSKNNCNKFLYKSGGSIFIGCSPERLFSIKKNILITEAVAGSTKRGLSIEEDERLSSILLSSLKEKEEHQYVVDYLLKRLKKHCNGIEYADKLRVKKTEQLQHLWLPIQCKLKDGFSLFALFNDLFPTPAVCGIPKEDAYKTISVLEDYQRGLFTGIIGWFNKSEADIAVGIRSALIKENQCNIFAGCGIVAASNPGAEYNETELKMKTILSILNDEN